MHHKSTMHTCVYIQDKYFTHCMHMYSNKECPTCRKKLVSKRSLRADPNFDKLIAKVRINSELSMHFIPLCSLQIYPNREELAQQVCSPNFMQSTCSGTFARTFIHVMFGCRKSKSIACQFIVGKEKLRLRPLMEIVCRFKITRD